MATITSATSGNFSSPATWVGGIVPGPLDNARANTGHNVTIDVNTTVIDIQSVSTGRFIMGEGVTLTGNVIAPASVNITLLIPVTTNCTIIGNLTLLTTAGSLIAEKTGTGSLNIFGNVGGGSSTNMRGLVINNTGTVNITGNLIVTTNAGVNAACPIVCNSDATINVVGNLTCPQIVSNNTLSPAITSSSNNIVINITGNVQGGSNSAITLGGTSPVLTIIGNILEPLGTGTVACVNITGQNAIVNINGNVYGGVYGNGVTLTGVNSLCTIIGNLYANNSSILTNAINSSANIANKGLILSGDFYYGLLGAMPYRANIVKVIPTTNGRTVYYDTIGNTYIRASLTAVNFNVPLVEDVRQGIVYGDSGYTGTLIVPSPSNVRKDVPTDNTVGTADLTAADFWNYLTTNVTTPNSIGKVIKDNLDSQVSTRLATSGYTAPDNSSIATIKSKTDLIPNNPASVESVGAIVASYNS